MEAAVQCVKDSSKGLREMARLYNLNIAKTCNRRVWKYARTTNGMDRGAR